MVEEVTAHKKERSFYDMSGADNIYKYITTDGKVFGEEAKKFTMLEYLQKSTGVFNQNGMLSSEEVKQMKKRAQSGDKNIWHGFISFDEKHSEMIDHPEKCIELIKKTFGEFFKDANMDKDNMDLMCALHLDKPHHLHIHYVFWEKEPKIKNKRAAGYVYRAKGKIPLDVIAKMTERLNAYTIEDNVKGTRNDAVKAISDWKGYTKATYRDIAIGYMHDLAKKLPQDKEWHYASKHLKPYRNQIDEIVNYIILTNDKARQADKAFRDEMRKKKTELHGIMGKWYKGQLERDKPLLDSEFSIPIVEDLPKIHTIEKLEWDYRRRLGNAVLKQVKYISLNTFEYDKKEKRKSNDKWLKKNLAVSSSIIRRSMKGFFSSFISLITPEVASHRNRLQEIEEEIKRQNIKEKEEQQQNEVVKKKWQWSK